MLPYIEDHLNLQEVPYRLPSRCNTYSGVNAPCQIHLERNSCYQSPISRAYTNVDYYMKRKGEESAEELRRSRINPLLLSNTEEMHLKKSECKTTKKQFFILRSLESLNEITKMMSSRQKLIWIEELNQWIIQEPSVVEFMTLTKKSTLFENESFLESLPKIKRIKTEEELELCDRFSRHLNTKLERQRIQIVKNSSTNKKFQKSQRNYRMQTAGRIPHPALPGTNAILEKKKKVDDMPPMDITKDLETFGSQSSLNQLSQPGEKEEMSEEDEKGDQEIMKRFSVHGENEKIQEESVQSSDVLTKEVISENEDYLEKDDSVLFSENKVQYEDISEDLLESSHRSKSKESSITKSEKGTMENFITNGFEDYKETQSVKDFTDSKSKEINRPISAEEQESKKEIHQRSGKIRTKTNIQHRVNFDSVPSILNFQKIKKVKELKVEEDPEYVEDQRIKEGPSVENDTTQGGNPYVLKKVINDEKETPSSEIHEIERDKMAPLLPQPKKRWGKKKLDLTYTDELEKERLSEIHKLKVRKKLQIAIEKMKRNKHSKIPDGPRFESYGFLAKYCILKEINVGLYRNTFDVCDETKKHWLTYEELMMALRGVNPGLKDCDLAHLDLVMETCEYRTRNGADFQLFSVLAALSVQITTLDSWIKNFVGDMEFELLVKKVRYCRKLWECLVDSTTNTVSVNSLCIELQAGGVTQNHIQEVRDRLGQRGDLTLLDFLAYVPLFIILHLAIVDNPLDMSEKI